MKDPKVAEARLKWLNALEKLLDSKPWLFDHDNEVIDMNAYVPYFARKSQRAFTVFEMPWAYDDSILDQFKDRVIASSFTSSDGSGGNLTTIIQRDEQFHLMGRYIYLHDEEVMATFVTIYSGSQKELLKFYQEHKKFMIKPDAPALGFGNGSGSLLKVI